MKRGEFSAGILCFREKMGIRRSSVAPAIRLLLGCNSVLAMALGGQLGVRLAREFGILANWEREVIRIRREATQDAELSARP
jgi:hypothetical protein